ncbi:hypothetical protein LJR225_004193 [Phenylobacterium sp. LjRoot225]|uniref:hypothetical protein n=1 Tax=Phenylobacterium sp. LjRoot225 TaxID=3342285 RepID=UPI003ECF67BC
MFERAPFQYCPGCRQSDLGILSVGGDALTRRCRRCRYGYSEALPEVDKKVIYLDQLAISEIFKIRSGTRRPGANSEAFWREAERLIRRVHLLQQAVFPDSNIHTDETLVYRSASELRLAHEMLGGDVSFKNIDDVINAQTWAFFKAFLAGCEPPELTFDVDEVLEGSRNAWLSDMHISTNMDLSRFADGVRASRDRAGDALAELAEHWGQEKPTFKQALKRELESYGRSHMQALAAALRGAAEANESGDWMAMLDSLHSPAYVQFGFMADDLRRRGSSSEEASETVVRFWNWKGNWRLPHHRISAHLFAGLARKMAAGQKELPTRGFFNDVNAVSVYGPYVDAIFLDNGCAGLVREMIQSGVTLKAKVFSPRSGDQFLAYLEELETKATAEVREYAHEAYGIT